MHMAGILRRGYSRYLICRVNDHERTVQTEAANFLAGEFYGIPGRREQPTQWPPHKLSNLVFKRIWSSEENTDESVVRKYHWTSEGESSRNVIQNQKSTRWLHQLQNKSLFCILRNSRQKLHWIHQIRESISLLTSQVNQSYRIKFKCCKPASNSNVAST